MNKSKCPKQPAIHPIEWVVVFVLVAILVICVVKVKQEGKPLLNIGNSQNTQRVVED
jgi:hypothetical protein